MAHRDIKPANIFLDGHGKYKLGDFGSACLVHGEERCSADGTSDYLSPEMRRCLLGEEMEVDYFQSDVFSLGVTMLFLARLSLPSSIPKAWRYPQQLKQVVEVETSGLSYSTDFLKLLRQMLESDPEQRPSIEKLLFGQSLIDGGKVDISIFERQLDLNRKRKTAIHVLWKRLRYLSNQVDRDSLNLQWQLASA